LPGGDEDRAEPAAAGFEVELERDGLLPDRAVGAHREDDRRRQLEVLARGDVQARRRPAQVTQLDVVLARERHELVVLADELVQAALDVEPRRDRLLQQLAPGGREAAALRGDADDRRRRPERQRLLDRRDHRDAVVAFARVRRVENRDGRVGRVAQDPARRLAVVRVVGTTLSQYEVPLL
jgi:hypothetical protein